MNERRSNEEREAMLADAKATALDPEGTAELALLADLLADPSTWAEPSAALEDAVVRAVADAEPTATRTPFKTPRWRRVALSAVAAAAAIGIGIGVVASQRGTTSEFTAELAATNLAPGASGSADITHNNAGFRITLQTHGLSALPAGQYYEAWLKNAAGARVPIGTFSSSDGRVTLWSGVSPKDFPTLTVTVENEHNEETAPGRPVLAGNVHPS